MREATTLFQRHFVLEVPGLGFDFAEGFKGFGVESLEVEVGIEGFKSSGVRV